MRKLYFFVSLLIVSIAPESTTAMDKDAQDYDPRQDYKYNPKLHYPQGKYVYHCQMYPEKHQYDPTVSYVGQKREKIENDLWQLLHKGGKRQLFQHDGFENLPLIVAVHCNSVDLVEEFLRVRANPLQENKYGHSAWSINQALIKRCELGLRPSEIVLGLRNPQHEPHFSEHLQYAEMCNVRVSQATIHGLLEKHIKKHAGKRKR